MRNNQIAILTIMVFVLIYFFSLHPGGLNITDEYISLIPSAIVVIFSIYGAKKSHGISGILAYFMIGVGLALSMGELNALNVIIPDWLSATLTLQYLQAITIILSTMIGVVFNG